MISYDDRMRVKEKAYLDMEGEPCLIDDGYAGVLFTYASENGDEKERIEYLDADEQPQPAINKEKGYACVEYKPDEEAGDQNGGHAVILEYYDQSGEQIRLQDKGYSKVRQTYDQRGLLIRETYYNGEESASRKDYMVSGIDYEYSDDGNLICEIYKDSSDNPVNRYDTGFAMKFQEYEKGKLVKVHYKGYKDHILQDVPNKKYGIGMIRYIYANGHEVEAHYLDINGMPALRIDLGYAVRKTEYNDRGLTAAQRFYGTDGELILRKDKGYAAITYQYDNLGRETSQRYYGMDERPVISTYFYCAGMQYQYDERGNRSDIQYLDENGNLMMRRDLGYAWIKRGYNEDGKIVKEAYYDGEEQLVESKEGGYAFYEAEYEGEKLTRIKYKSRYDKLVLHKDTGYAIATYRYNEDGKCIWELYFDKDAQPIISKKYHCAGFRTEYDEANNRRTVSYLDLDGQEMTRSDLGYACVCKQYDAFGNLIGETYYDALPEQTTGSDAERKLILCKEGG